jgi:5-(carboxyamino)imidazole ribonucleotide synthase
MAELPLGSPLMLYDSAMINLLGKNEYVGVPQYKNLDKIASIPGVYIHLYGKSQMKPDRKMGHITLIALNHENIHEKISKVKLLLA